MKVQDLDGHVHWVNRTQVSRKINCAVVKTKTARLRRGPGHNQPLAELASADRYTSFVKVDRDGEWVKVRDSFNGTYWIHETAIWIPVVKTQLSF